MVTIFFITLVIFLWEKNGVMGFVGTGARMGLAYGMGGTGEGVGSQMLRSRIGLMSGGLRGGRFGTVNAMSPNNNMAHYPPGVKLVDGELMDVTNKVIQKAGTVGGGTQYFSFMNPKGGPIFRRKEIDTGRHFIVFPDANFMPGDGHYIVLRKVRGFNNAQLGGPMYEAFYLDLGDSINALVSNFNSMTYEPNLARSPAMGMAKSIMKMKGGAVGG